MKLQVLDYTRRINEVRLSILLDTLSRKIYQLCFPGEHLFNLLQIYKLSRAAQILPLKNFSIDSGVTTIASLFVRVKFISKILFHPLSMVSMKISASWQVCDNFFFRFAVFFPRQ